MLYIIPADADKNMHDSWKDLSSDHTPFCCWLKRLYICVHYEITRVNKVEDFSICVEDNIRDPFIVVERPQPPLRKITWLEIFNG